ncbi:MAG: type I 3-dehydroquinate dehydratase [Methanoregula sp.]|nr:MAG: type I 3-dehydroquinate dehydratase [Methanoregula sp.]
MKIVASLTDPCQIPAAAGADLIEIRLDLCEGDVLKRVRECREQARLPVIATLRSAEEGGRFKGDSGDWIRVIRPVLPHVDYVDIEQRFSTHADVVRAKDVAVIASYHTKDMPSLFELFGRERELRAYGDIPKVVATPRNEEDIIEMISFTHAARKPVITGVMGEGFRYARLILPLFGSEFIYCHAGAPTADGQYSVAEAKEAMKLLDR